MFKNLKVWQEAMKFAKEIYVDTRAFPQDEKFGMISQLRRAAVSIPANLSEGSTRGSKKDYKHFVNIARGSCAELETLIQLSIDLEYTKSGIWLLNRLSDIGKMLRGLESSLTSD